MISAAEGWRWLQRLLPGVPRDNPHRLWALLTAGMLAGYVSAFDQGASLLREALTIARHAGDPAGEAWARLWLGRLAAMSEEADSAEEHLQSALEAVVAAAAEAGAGFLFSQVLRLVPGIAEYSLPFLAREFPRLVERYRHLYHGNNAAGSYAEGIGLRLRELKTKYDLHDRPVEIKERISRPAPLRQLSLLPAV
jgi:hypothetical protein